MNLSDTHVEDDVSVDEQSSMNNLRIDFPAKSSL